MKKLFSFIETINLININTYVMSGNRNQIEKRTRQTLILNSPKKKRVKNGIQ